MNTKLSVLAVCLAVGFSMVAPPSEARSKAWLKRHAAPEPVAAAQDDSDDGSHDNGNHKGQGNLPAAKYPNGTGWRAIELDFIDVKERIDVVEGKVDDVKADTETILEELDEVDADHVMIKDALADLEADHDDLQAEHVIIMDKLDTIDTELGDVADEVLSVADDVATLKNTLQVQVSVEAASADDRNEVNDAPVSLFVQVNQNGLGLSGLTADAFAFSNSFPDGGAGYCGTDACFVAGANGLYRIAVEGDWVAGAYAGTLSALDGSSSAAGTSIVTFDIPAEPTPPEAP